MGVIFCNIDPYREKQLIRIEDTHTDYWVYFDEVADTIYKIVGEEKRYNGVWFEGPYVDCFDIMNIYQNKYPESDICFTVN